MRPAGSEVLVDRLRLGERAHIADHDLEIAHLDGAEELRDGLGHRRGICEEVHEPEPDD